MSVASDHVGGLLLLQTRLEQQSISWIVNSHGKKKHPSRDFDGGKLLIRLTSVNNPFMF
jgi:hypothetical protein